MDTNKKGNEMKTNWNEMVNHEGYVRPVTVGRVRADELWDKYISNSCPIMALEMVRDDGGTAILREKEFCGWIYHIIRDGEYVHYCTTKREALNY